jgi:hypothetical protein
MSDPSNSRELGQGVSRVARVEILLTHEEHGPVWVYVWDEATWWMGKRQWVIADDPERGTFEDGDFEERPDQIEEALAIAAAPYADDTDANCTVRCDPRAFQRW